MNQPKQMKRIYQLEEMLHNIKDKPNKEQERKVIFAELDKLSNEIKEK